MVSTSSSTIPPLLSPVLLFGGAAVTGAGAGVGRVGEEEVARRPSAVRTPAPAIWAWVDEAGTRRASSRRGGRAWASSTSLGDLLAGDGEQRVDGDGWVGAVPGGGAVGSRLPR